MKLLNIELVHPCLYNQFLCSSYDPQSLLVFFVLLCGFAITKAAYIGVDTKLNIECYDKCYSVPCGNS